MTLRSSLASRPSPFAPRLSLLAFRSSPFAPRLSLLAFRSSPFAPRLSLLAFRSSPFAPRPKRIRTQHLCRHSRESGNPFSLPANVKMDSRFRGNDDTSVTAHGCARHVGHGACWPTYVTAMYTFLQRRLHAPHAPMDAPQNAHGGVCARCG